MRNGWFLVWFAAATAVTALEACSGSTGGLSLTDNDSGAPGAGSSGGGSSSGSKSGSGSSSGSKSGSGSSGSGHSSSGANSSSGSGTGSSSGSMGSSSGSSNDDGGSNDAGPPPPACSCEGAANCVIWQNVFMTNYGYDDNSCQTEAQMSCGDIAFPGLGPMMHQQATEGAGTYDDPITAAAAANGDGSGGFESQGGATLSPGTIIYNPLTQKYYIMEDSCAECTSDYNCQYDDDEGSGSAIPGDPPASCSTDQFLHIDFWMGPTTPQNSTTLENCEGNTTIGDTYDLNGAIGGPLNSGTTDGTVIINPPSDLPVNPSTLFLGNSSATGGCWATTQLIPNQEYCY